MVRTLPLLGLLFLVGCDSSGDDARALSGTYTGSYESSGTPIDVTMTLAEQGGAVTGTIRLTVGGLPTTEEYTGTYDHPDLRLQSTGTDARFEGSVSGDRDAITGRFPTGTGETFTVVR